MNIVEILRAACIRAATLDLNLDAEDDEYPLDAEHRLEFFWTNNSPSATDRAKKAVSDWYDLEYPEDYNDEEGHKKYREASEALLSIVAEECPVTADNFVVEFSEERGEHVEKVWRYVPTAEYFRATADYYSYSGTGNWSSFQLVEPRLVTITKYFPKETL